MTSKNRALADLIALSMPTPPAPGRYRHFKGNYYRVIGIIYHSEDKGPDGEPALMVLYVREKDGSRWCRPLAMWSEPIPPEKLAAHGIAPNPDGSPVLRFTPCLPAPALP